MKKISRRSFLTVCGAAAAAAALTACGGSASSASTTASSVASAASSAAGSTAAGTLSGNVATGGSTSMKNVIAALTEGFAEVEPGVTVSYDPTGSGAGITGATDKTLDIGLSSRALKDDEKNDVDGTTVALDGIAIIVNKDSKVADLTVDQLKQMFTGEITNWSEVGGDDGEIVLIGREAGSGTRDGFESIVDVKDSCKYAQELTATGAVISAVEANPLAIGYASLSAVGDTVAMVTVEGVECSEDTVKDGSYKIQRPFVVMTHKGQTLTPVTADFMSYLKSAAAKNAADAAGCIYLSDPAKRANAGAEAIPVVSFEKQASLPEGGKIVVRGSTSMEKFTNAAAKAYAAVYGVKPEDVFDIQLEGSSVGRKAAENDTVGNVIGLSSAAVKQDNIDSFNVCLDAVAVIVNKENTAVSDLTLEQLYAIFSGKTTKFSELSK